MSGGEASRPAHGALAGHVAVAMLVALELIRTTGPLLDSVYAERGLEAAIGAALVTYLAPVAVVALAVGVARRLRRGHPLALLGATVALAVLRLTAQAASGELRLAVGLAAVAVAVAVLVLGVTLLVERSASGRLAAAAIATGAGTGVALQLALGTWDAYWRTSPLGWGVSSVVVGALLALAAMAVADRGAAGSRRARRVWSLGPFLAVTTVVTASVPFAASQSGISTQVAGPVAAAGLLASAALCLRWPPSFSPAGPLIVIALALPLLLFSVLRMPVEPLSGLPVLAVLVTTQVASVLVVGSALEPSRELPPQRSSRGLGAAVAAGAVGLGAIVPIMLYQVDYDTPLGFPNELVLVAAAGLLALGGMTRRGGHSSPAPAGLFLPVAGAASVVLAVGATIVASAVQPPADLDSPTPTEDGSVRVLVWNVHYAVSADGALELETIADVVERHEPDVVLLNEVSRGWLIGGGADMASWLADRLGGHHAFAPAADRQFGNVVVSRWPLRDVEVHRLPYGQGPQHRSALAATVSTGAGELRVVSAHLQQYRSSEPTRMQQLGVLLPRLESSETGAIVVGGDFNARPEDPEIALMTAAGYLSAVDEVGDPLAMTIPSAAPTARYDWLFGRGVRFTRADVLVRERASDHLPILATVVPLTGSPHRVRPTREAALRYESPKLDVSFVTARTSPDS